MGALLPAHQEAVVKAPQVTNSDSDSDDYLEVVRKMRTSILDSVASPSTFGQESSQETPIHAQLKPPAALESNPEEDKEEEFHTPSGSPTGTGRQSPPIITSQSSPGERLVPEGQSNVFSHSMPRYQGERVVKCIYHCK